MPWIEPDPEHHRLARLGNAGEVLQRHRDEEEDEGRDALDETNGTDATDRRFPHSTSSKMCTQLSRFV